MATKLSVNINKVALIRNARGANIPDLMEFARKCQDYGADGITVHPRPDERHITREDVRNLSKLFPNEGCEYNIEGYPTEDFIRLVLEAKPSQVTLVPDDPQQLTSDHGWDAIAHRDMLTESVKEFRSNNIRTSLFIDPIPQQLEAVKQIGADRIEFYTGPYAHDFPLAQSDEQRTQLVHSFVAVLPLINELSLGINAGHDLNLDNLSFLKESIPQLLEVSIGQALVRDCLYFGLENTIPMYKRLLC